VPLIAVTRAWKVPGMDAITAAKIEEYTAEVAIDPDWSTHKITWSSSALLTR
jgi:hypothetical protein